MWKTYVWSVICVAVLMVWLPTTVCAGEEPLERTVFLPILARNKAHFLPAYLEKIAALDYPKSSIILYVNTNNNTDATAEILENWLNKHRSLYKEVIFEKYDIPQNVIENPHDWQGSRLRLLGQIREKSLQLAMEKKSDYYFIVDCDNFIEPRTLRVLMSKNKPIIAPLLVAAPHAHDPYGNFFPALSASGFYQHERIGDQLVRREKKGTFLMPVVHCTYLIDGKYLPKLHYVDGTDQYEFLIFSSSARANGVEQWICNEEDFGILWHSVRPPGEVTLQDEREEWARFVQEHPDLKMPLQKR